MNEIAVSRSLLNTYWGTLSAAVASNQGIDVALGKIWPGPSTRLHSRWLMYKIVATGVSLRDVSLCSFLIISWTGRQKSD